MNPTSVGIGLGGSLNAPVSVSSTEQQTLSLHESVGALQDLVGILNQRLSSVLRSSKPSVSENSAKTDQEIPPLANAIRQSRYSIQQTNSTLEDILSRLDI